MHVYTGDKKLAMNKEEKIAQYEAELKTLKAKSFTTTNGGYGTKDYKTLEAFENNVFNIQKNPDLMPCPRRLKK